MTRIGVHCRWRCPRATTKHQEAIPLDRDHDPSKLSVVACPRAPSSTCEPRPCRPGRLALRFIASSASAIHVVLERAALARVEGVDLDSKPSGSHQDSKPAL